ncbi:unnamed protein product [Vicia faba]|uniref:Uncharacterized protein n=1 Tax=Vicia faba TaxID=3906 RepID=A0AAV1B421_VICFA|nr:unnamed protein product [Vicia faba]
MNGVKELGIVDLFLKDWDESMLVDGVKTLPDVEFKKPARGPESNARMYLLFFVEPSTVYPLSRHPNSSTTLQGVGIKLQSLALNSFNIAPTTKEAEPTLRTSTQSRQGISPNNVYVNKGYCNKKSAYSTSQQLLLSQPSLAIFLRLVSLLRGNGVTKKKDLLQSQVQRLVGKPFNSSQSLNSHECETVATDHAYQSSSAYSSGTKPRFLWIQSCGKIHIYFRAIQLVVSPVNPWDTSESILKSPKNWVHEALDTPSWASLDAPTPNKLLVGIVKLSLFGHKDNSSYLIRSGAGGPRVTRDW